MIWRVVCHSAPRNRILHRVEGLVCDVEHVPLVFWLAFRKPHGVQEVVHFLLPRAFGLFRLRDWDCFRHHGAAKVHRYGQVRIVSQSRFNGGGVQYAAVYQLHPVNGMWREE